MRRSARYALAAGSLTRLSRVGAPIIPECLWRMPDVGRTVYLTFDDGPDPESTPTLLDALSNAGARATFFVLGEAVEREPGLAREIRAEGHAVGQHGHTHLDAWRARPASVVRDAERAAAVLEDTLGEAITWVRPPYGHITPALMRWARTSGRRIALWDVMPGDFLPSATAPGVTRHVEQWVRPGSIIVLHEGPRCGRIAAEAVRRLTTSPKLEDYRFDSL